MPWVAYARGVRIAWGWTGRALAVLVAGVVCLSVGGCTGSEPKPTPSVTATSASPTPSASASVTIPEEAKAHTPEGGIAFAKFAILEAGQALAINDASRFEDLALPTCKSCAVVSSTVADQLAQNKWAPKQRIVLSGAQQFDVYEADRMQVDLLGKEVASDLVDKTGAVVGHVDEAVLRMRMALTWTADGWRVYEMAAVNV